FNARWDVRSMLSSLA
ncbi:unnamed protein product, partial [Oikopleura dioica]